MHTTGVLGTLCSQLYRCGPRRGTVAIIGICLFLTAGTASSNEPDVDTFATERAPIRIAVIAHWGIEKARKAWFPIATYLAKELNWAVEIIPLALSDMDQTVRDQKIDFVIVNPGAYVELSLKYGISVLGTLEKHIDGYPISAFGGVVFAKADRSDLNSLPDLADKKLLAVSAISFGGFQVFLREIKKIGMDPDADNINIAFTDFPHDNVVTRVLAGDADAGVVRTGVLEAMAHEEKIDLNDVRIIGSRTHPRFPLAASTDLYPEWAFAKLNHVPEALAKDVLRALLTINDTHAAARAGRYSGWTVPLDYTPVHNLFKELKIGPYKPRHTLLVEFLQRYWMVVAFIVLLILGVVTYSLLARRLVTSRTLELRLANEDLLREGEERAYAEEITARLGRILENSWNEIYIFDATTYEFIQVNHGALANMGYSMDEMRNLTAYDIKPHFDRESFIAAVQPLVGGSQVFLVFETVHARKDRTIYPVEVRLQLLANENPPIFVAVIIDITERHRAEQEIRDLNASLERRVEERTCELRAEVREREMAEDKLRETEAKTRQIVNSAVDGIITIDEQGIILTYNRAAEDMFEYSVAEAVGKNISLLMPKNVAEQHDGYLENFHRTGIAKIIGMRREVVARRKNGSNTSAYKTDSRPILSEWSVILPPASRPNTNFNRHLNYCKTRRLNWSRQRKWPRWVAWSPVSPTRSTHLSALA